MSDSLTNVLRACGYTIRTGNPLKLAVTHSDNSADCPACSVGNRITALADARVALREAVTGCGGDLNGVACGTYHEWLGERMYELCGECSVLRDRAIRLTIEDRR